MSTSDRAFIKAYGRDAAEAVPPPPHMPLSGMPAAGQFADGMPSVEEIYGTRPLPRSPGEASGHAAPQSAAPSQVTKYVPPPHIPLPFSTAPEAAPREPLHVGTPGPAAHVAGTRADVVAGGSYAGGPTPASAEHGPTTERFEPAFEVDAFRWPEACETLLARCGQEFDHLAERFAATASGWGNVVAVTGPRRGEGRTTTLLCAARRLSSRGIRTVLVDGDFEKPALAERLGVDVHTGWDNALRGEVPLAEAVVASNREDLALLPMALPVSQWLPLARGVHAATTFDVLRANYDVVLLDAGPVDEREFSALPLLATGRVRMALLVHDVRVSPEYVVAEAGQMLSTAGVVAAGVAVNFMHPAKRPARPGAA